MVVIVCIMTYILWPALRVGNFGTSTRRWLLNDILRRCQETNYSTFHTNKYYNVYFLNNILKNKLNMELKVLYGFC